MFEFNFIPVSMAIDIDIDNYQQVKYLKLKPPHNFKLT
jgi:hypothetical protein